jgi:hypothetical protein
MNSCFHELYPSHFVPMNKTICFCAFQNSSPAAGVLLLNAVRGYKSVDFPAKLLFLRFFTTFIFVMALPWYVNSPRRGNRAVTTLSRRWKKVCGPENRHFKPSPLPLAPQNSYCHLPKSPKVPKSPQKSSKVLKSPRAALITFIHLGVQPK